MLGKLRRRLAGLYRLPGAHARLSALEGRVDRMQGALQDQRGALRSQQEALDNQRGALRSQQEALDNQTDISRRRTEALAEQLNMLKSSLDVPRGLAEEFHGWKARNPLPGRPTVSVVVATYNRAKILTERCVPSVLGQTYGDLELIVVGDGCTDETEEALAAIKDPRLRFVNLRERGSYPADPRLRWMVAGTLPTNHGVSISRGDLLSHLDDDDEYAPDRLERLVEFMVEGGLDLAWHPYWTQEEDGGWKLVASESFVYGQITNAAVLYRSWFGRLRSDPECFRLMEPGDWNRFRKIKYLNPAYARYPEPLLTKYH